LPNFYFHLTTTYAILRLDVESRVEPEKTRPRYLLLEPIMRDEAVTRRGR
jgi:hypothetical protein